METGLIGVTTFIIIIITSMYFYFGMESFNLSVKSISLLIRWFPRLRFYFISGYKLLMMEAKKSKVFMILRWNFYITPPPVRPFIR